MNTSQEHGQTFQCRVTSEAVTKFKQKSPEIEYEEIDSNQLESIQPRNKILIQRVFHQPIRGAVEQKLDYIVATSDDDITRHVFGGLFHNRYYDYQPEDYCRKHDPNLDEYIDESMPKLGDKFDSLETFRLYVDSHAKQWKYYLKCTDSHKAYGKTSFVYKCVFASTHHSDYYNAKGLRKRTPKVVKKNCPCRVLLKPVPTNSDTLTVIYVCNHHDHPVTKEYFEKLQHGRRIHPSIREEIMDFLSLDVDREIVKRHFECLTGFKMGNLYFNNLLQWMKKNNVERQFTLEKLKAISRKVGKIKEDLGIDIDKAEEEHVDDDLVSTDKASQVQEAINVLKSVAAPTKAPKPKSSNTGKKRPKVVMEETGEVFLVDPNEAPPTNKSRLETRLQELTYDHETLESIKHLQDSVRETEEWSGQQEFDSWNRGISGHRKKRIRNSQKNMPIIEQVLEPQTVYVENPQDIDNYTENQEIVYDNQIAMGSPAEDGHQIIYYEHQEDNNSVEIANNDNEVQYCIQYEGDTGTEAQTDQEYFFIENLDNVPEVRIQATDFATVSIVSPNENTANDTQVKTEQMNTEMDNNIEGEDTHFKIPVVKTECEVDNGAGDSVVKVEKDNIKVIGDGMATTFELGPNAVYELIETNDKKLYPTKDVVRDTQNKKRKRSSKKPNVDTLEDEDSLPTEFLEDMDSQQRTSEQEDVESLDDDDFYMVVVNDDQTDEQSAAGNAYEDFRNELMKESYIKNEPEISKDDVQEEYLDKKVVQCVNKKVQCDITNTEDIDREIKTISRLKRIKRSLMQDIKQLVTTKDVLVKEIMKAKKLKRPKTFD